VHERNGQFARGSNQQFCAAFLNDVENVLEGWWWTLNICSKFKSVFFLVQMTLTFSSRLLVEVIFDNVKIVGKSV